jgi:hypothetical protein
MKFIGRIAATGVRAMAGVGITGGQATAATSGSYPPIGRTAPGAQQPCLFATASPRGVPTSRPTLTRRTETASAAGGSMWARPSAGGLAALLDACALPHHGWTLSKLRNGRAKTAAEMTTEMVQ